MSDDVQIRIAGCVAKVLALNPAHVKSEQALVDDLGAESLDLVELMYVLEAEFGIRLEQRDLSLTAQLGLPESEIRAGEVLTPRAIELLRERFPRGHAILVPGVTRRQLAALLTVGELERSIRNKLVVARSSEQQAAD